MNRCESKRVLAIGLDGYEPSLGDALMAAGELPALASLRRRSARFLLDHGSAQRTGLAWEHVSTGRSPEAAQRWSAVDLDPATYEVWQEGTSLEPFPARLDVPTVVFDAPYFDLDRAPAVRGVVDWGAHDPGAPHNARPQSVLAELNARWPYPAREWIYGIVWPSVERTRAMSEALTRAVALRAEAATWLLQTRLPDWQLGLVVVSELHSATEGLWHGIDPRHPLHGVPSAGPAGDGLRAVYRAVDRLVGQLIDAFSDARVVVFTMGGMGPNRSDVPCMVLLSELLHRHAFAQPLLRERRDWTSAPAGTPMLGEHEDWSIAVNAQLGVRPSAWRLLRRGLARRLPSPVKHAAQRTIDRYTRSAPSRGRVRLSLDWMPASHYQPYWRSMRFFALPSFYDGRIRLNLAGRERAGTVPLSDYAAVCDEAEALVAACRDARTGEPVVERVERCGGADPRALGPSGCDLAVVWRATPLGFEHPMLGRIGPVPFRRSGGHTGPFGMAYVSGRGIGSDDFGVRSSFDVVPTIIDLLGQPLPPGVSGRSLLERASVHYEGTKTSERS